jgi:NAD-dependent deacetylase
VPERGGTGAGPDVSLGIDDSLVDLLRSRPRTVVVTGAGVSAESGIPTFRDAMTGLWARYRPEDLATPEGFRRDPALVWEWYEWRRGLVSSTEPNPGHQTCSA